LKHWILPVAVFGKSLMNGRSRGYLCGASRSLRERALEVGQMLRDDNTHIYVFGLKGMEQGAAGAQGNR
jgi:hypothetical protein